MNVVWSFELHVIFSVLALLLVEEEGGVFVNEDFKTDCHLRSIDADYVDCWFECLVCAECNRGTLSKSIRHGV
jgi:hypothetical protein